ncbi:MAG: molybdenum cofactor biosysynthesis protein, partial [Verrucomicrobiota bacterium]|nr:molybdenum cofactor biosysynthesis protein [Verrucomicrobiota bacterium]
MLIRQIFISPGHNFFGHHGQPPDDHPLQEVAEIECVAGRGLRGDRFFDYKDNYKGQITFFSQEIFEALCAAFPLVDKSAGVLRRNIIVADVDLNALIGQAFELQGVHFLGTAHCTPCYWLDQAFAP